MTDDKTPDIFTQRLKPRLVALETYTQQLKQLSNSTNKSGAFRKGIDLAAQMIQAQTEMYNGIQTLRELNIMAPNGDDKIAEEMSGIVTMLESLKDLNR
ncbi:MAG: hypothetical protein FWF97_01165 [Alphaproteobacteria bacterium]|nr:hypothetical protein [Alphaproteobacteria bacterium]